MLKDFQPKELAGSVAALKVYLALCLNATRAPTALLEEAGLAKLSYSDLCRLTNLARATVSRGLDILKEKGLIEARAQGRSTVYKVINFDAKSDWAKLPLKLCSANDNKLAFFSARNSLHLGALKLYMLILASRQRNQNHAAIGYDRIVEQTGMRRDTIRQAISLLTELKLVVIDRSARFMDVEHGPNMYLIEGLGAQPVARTSVTMPELGDPF